MTTNPPKKKGPRMMGNLNDMMVAPDLSGA